MEKEVKAAIIAALGTIMVAVIGIYANSFFHPEDPTNSQLPIVWNFDDARENLDGWERTGTTVPWKTLSDTVEWHDKWGDAEGVIVIDSCYKPAENIDAAAGIKKSMHIPSKAKSLVADIVKIEQDGGIRFAIMGSSGSHILGEERLSGRTKKTVSYDITKWAGESVTLEIMSFGWGVPTGTCPAGTENCCGEYIGLDKVEII